MAKIKKLIPVLSLLLLTIPLVWPLLQPGFFVTDDGNWMIIRLAAFHQTLRSGQFPVRFLYSLNHGFGYPVTNFLYPLPFYLGEIIHIIGFDFTNSVKILLALSFPLSALGMYLFIRTKLGEWPAIASAIFYVYAPYRIFDVYQRGSLGEAVAFIFIPFVFYALKTSRPILAALSLAALITSHNVIAFIFLPLIFLYRPNIRVFLLSFCLSAFFWLPALHDLQFTKAGSTAVSDFSKYFLNANNFINLAGIIILVILAVSLPLMLKRQTKIFYLSLGAVLVSLFLASPVSAVLWQNFSLPKVIQFPWRFLSVTAFAASILLAFGISRLRPLFTAFIIAAIAVLSFPRLNLNRTYFPDSYYATNDDTTTVKNEYMSKWVKIDPQERAKSYMEYISNTTVQINQIYFPGWEVTVDGQKVPIFYDNTRGLIQVVVSPGSHLIKANFGETPLRTVANAISLLAAMFLLIKTGSSAVLLIRRK